MQTPGRFTMPAKIPPIAIRLVLCGLVFGAAWYALGPIGLVIASPVAAAAFARPILAALSGGVRLARTVAYRPVEGSHYAYHGRPIAVWEDVEECRWLRAVDVRRVLSGFPRDEVLHKVLAEGVCVPLKGMGLYVRADSLLELLSRAEQPGSLRFKTWVQREVHFPSGLARRRGEGPTARSGGGRPA